MLRNQRINGRCKITTKEMTFENIKNSAQILGNIANQNSNILAINETINELEEENKNENKDIKIYEIINKLNQKEKELHNKGITYKDITFFDTPLKKSCIPVWSYNKQKLCETCEHFKYDFILINKLRCIKCTEKKIIKLAGSRPLWIIVDALRKKYNC